MIGVTCTGPDEYKQYTEGGEIIYLQKANLLEAYPGRNRVMLEWVIVDPKVTSCKVFYTQGGETDSLTVPINTRGGVEDDTTRVIIDNLFETTYAFKVISQDNMGNTSLAVEVDESVYGDVYENRLQNRVLKSKSVDNNGLLLDWYNADESEIAVEVKYTRNDGKPGVYYIPDTVITATIANFNVTNPFTYRALHLPAETAIDTFYTQPIEDRFVFPTVLTNTVAPFEIDSRGWWFDGRFGTPVGWIINEAASKNGNVDNANGTGLTFWAWSGYSPVGSFTDGKMYQTLFLEAGTYTFKATTGDVTLPSNEGYYAVVADYSLPNVSQVASEALAYSQLIATPKPADNAVWSFNFTLGNKTLVSIGLVANINSANQIITKKVELLKN
jgi:hypothetical protein